MLLFGIIVAIDAQSNNMISSDSATNAKKRNKYSEASPKISLVVGPSNGVKIDYITGKFPVEEATTTANKKKNSGKHDHNAAISKMNETFNVILSGAEVPELDTTIADREMLQPPPKFTGTSASFSANRMLLMATFGMITILILH